MADDLLTRPLAEADPEVAGALDAELRRQRTTLEMIASENFAPRSVLECQGSVLTNKYAEGYPGRRYYGGCEVVDRAEQIGIDRAKALFGAEHANLQPHSGASANLAVYGAFLQPPATDPFLRPAPLVSLRWWLDPVPHHAYAAAEAVPVGARGAFVSRAVATRLQDAFAHSCSIFRSTLRGY